MTQTVPQMIPPTSLPETDMQMDKLAEELQRLSKESLRVWLENMGYSAEAEVEKKDLINAVVELHKVRIKESDEQTSKATMQLEGEEDPILNITFHNHESPGADIEFVFDGGKGFQMSASGKPLPLPKFHLYDGRDYKLPLSVVRHLNNLKVAPDNVVTTNADGLIQSLYSGTPKKNRFSCSQNFTDDEIRRLNRKG